MEFVEYQKKKLEMLDSLGRYNGKCNGVSCGMCPLHSSNNGEDVYCETLELSYPEIAEKIVSEYKPKIDWTKVAVDTKVLVWSEYSKIKLKRYFSHYADGRIYVYEAGATSWTTQHRSGWDYGEIVEE